MKEIEISSKLVAYMSDQAHSSVQKACMIAGVPNKRRRIIEANDKEFSFDYIELEKQIKQDIKDGLIPSFCCVTVGTTSSTAVDDVAAIGKICKKYKIWMHVDSAFVGSSCIC